MIEPLYAHSVPEVDSSQWELLVDHLKSVATTASVYAKDSNASAMAGAIGWLHDLGKVKPGFQDKLHGAINQIPHSGEGALYASKNFGLLGKLMAYCIAGHHSGLPNGAIRAEFGRPKTPLKERIEQGESVPLPEGVMLPQQVLPGPLEGLSDSNLFEVQFFVRMMFSALVDADFIETENFYHPGARRPDVTKLMSLKQSLDDHLASFPKPETQINILRSMVLQAAGEKAMNGPGLFSLTVPTGGGKTLSSLRFAMDHALAHDLRRIIYVVPFTAIIEQTADVFRKALNTDDAVLEHHSSFDIETKDFDEAQVEQLKLAAQNWDRPVVVTTAVQFFESLFSNRTQSCRKLHNLARSVVVLDEAQTLPVAYLRPCLAALKELVRGYGGSVVFCTATQPAIRDSDGLSCPEAIDGEAVSEIAPEPQALYTQLKRVKAHLAGPLDNASLAAQVNGRKALVIVNNKRQARALFDKIGQCDALHLTTNMTARHRREVLAQIKKGFDGPVISTALIEAGVDIDFPEVWRAVAGLDSLAQAAGRCNRNGRLEGLGQFYIFEPDEAFPPPPELQRNADIARSVLQDHAEDPLHPNAVRAYFQRLYQDRSPDLDGHNIMRDINSSGNQFDFPFADISARFRIIQEVTCPLIVGTGDYGVSREVRDLLQYSHYAGSIARAVQPFTVPISPRVRDTLVQLGAAHLVRPDMFDDQFVILDNPRLYDAYAGFSAEDVEDLGVLIG